MVQECARHPAGAIRVTVDSARRAAVRASFMRDMAGLGRVVFLGDGLDQEAEDIAALRELIQSMGEKRFITRIAKYADPAG